MSHWPSDLVEAIDSRILTLLADTRPYRAVVTEVAASGMVKLRRAEAATASTELYARVAGFVVAVDDEVLCLDVAGRPIVVGIWQYAAIAAYGLDADLDLGGDVTALTGSLATFGNLTALDNVTLGDSDGEVILTRGHNRHKGAAPSIAVGVALGSGGSVGATITGTDEIGTIELVAGTSSLTTGVMATITFAATRGGTSYVVVLDKRNSTAGIDAVQRFTIRDSNSAWTIRCNVAPSSGATYSYAYRIKEYQTP